MEYSKSDSMEILGLDDTVTPPFFFAFSLKTSFLRSVSLSHSFPLLLSLPLLTCSV